MRMDTGVSDIGVGDSIMSPSGEALQIINDSDSDPAHLVIARNIPFNQCYYPNSDKVWFIGGLAHESGSGLTFVWNGFPADSWDGEELLVNIG